MNNYRIMHRETQQWWEGKAKTAHEACKKAGWPPEKCWVRQWVSSGRLGTGGQPTGGWGNPKDAPELGRRP